ncbi:Glycerol-3-phosphate acyltransferase [Candidatus Xenohaliotis californiensis]|uniref:Glycerol-3-phosphate acyltransferase n=1 Tax=Candidatus Xenohaliotis californiensis TaxID=84677 RepID=A0ABM9N8X3_9RICK|nr:Glycerol-3-phosphate acyltransferase [Candidatus Xenohaliotis californiensis]
MIKTILLILSYLLGSVSFGTVISNSMKMKNPRNAGSKNIGASNMIRVNGLRAGALTLLADGLKGAIPVLLTKHYYGSRIAMGFGIAAVVGHIFPIWTKFKGGKGVATGIFVITIINYKIGILSGLLWILVFFLSGYASLSSLTAIYSATIAIIMFDNQKVVLWHIILATLIFYKHAQNIQKLIKQTEHRFQPTNLTF